MIHGHLNDTAFYTNLTDAIRDHRDPTLGDAILDRIIHRAHRIELKGDSLRKRHTLATAESLTNATEK